MAAQTISPLDDRQFPRFSDAGHRWPLVPQTSIGNVTAGTVEITPTVDQTEIGSRSPLRAIALGPTRIVSSSLCSSWRGILLEKHLYFPGERMAASIDQHVISLFHGAPSRLEHRTLSGEFVVALIRPRSIMTTPAGLLPEMRLHTVAELTHCALQEGFLGNVADELDQPISRPMFRAGIEDKPIQRILGMLSDELEAERPLGSLYVDSLAHALATRYLLLDRERTAKSESRVAGLVPRLLNRVREKIEANLDAELSLESLAEESGYSRAHFLRMFRLATGLTPHQYVLDLRLRRAQERLRQPGSNIMDVALSCGFSSQSHMTSVFRQHLEMTPGEYRRNARSPDLEMILRQRHAI